MTRDDDRHDPSTGDGVGASGRSGGTSRRRFLQAVGSGALVGSVGAAESLADPTDAEFLDTDGTEFVLGDRPVYCNGTNNFWIADPYAERARVDDFMAICEAMNLNIVRTWAFCSGDGGHCLQPEPGVYDEAGFQHLDYIVAKAREAGVRLVLPLVNNWDDYGGMAKYVEWSATASGHDDFYVDEECQRIYREFVEYVLTRENTITGVEYRNEPAIGIWELANEPRAKEASDGVARVTQWIEESSALIKEIDPNHLVSTGMEGFLHKDPDGDWRHDGSHGTAYVDQHEIDTIDACSFHLYPNHWPGIDPTDPSDGVDWIVEHVRDAHETVGKPAYLGEFGINTNENSQAARDAAFEAYYDALDEYDAAGAMVWEIVRDSQSNHDGYAVYRDESSTTYLNEFTAAQLEKSGGEGGANGGPYADAVGPGTLRVGETGSFDGSLSFDPEQSISSYEWSFGDGATATGETAGHRYTAPGDYDVALSVTDDGGATATDTESVTVESPPAGSYLVEGAGEPVEGTTKQFHYAYVPVSGEFSLTTRVAELEPTHPAAQAGIATIDSLEDPGPLGAVTVTPGEGTELTRAYRDETWRERTAEGRSPPLWLRLERTARDGGGFDVVGSVSTDGSNWTEIQTGQVAMADDAYVGLYVSSNEPGELCTARFDEADWLDGWESTDVGAVEAAGYTASGSGDGSAGDGGDSDSGDGTDDDSDDTDTTAPPAPANLSVTGTTTSTVELSWDAVEDAGGSGLDRYAVSVDGSGEQTVPAGTTSATVEGLSPDTTYEVAVTAVDGAGNASAAATVTATTAAGEDGDGSDDDSDGGDDSDGEAPADALVVNDYDDDPSWSSHRNDLGQWCGAGSFENGGGAVEGGALVLEYDNGGWFQEQINRDVSDYDDLVLEVSGASGGEASEVRFSMGGASGLLADVTDDAIGTSPGDVRVDMEAAGVDRTSSGLSLRLNFWQGGASTLTIEAIRLE
jgi:mannan endo-1,4-beta-mannosidase